MAAVRLPDPVKEGGTSLSMALWGRRSVRAYGRGALGLEEISSLLWAAQGRTGRSRERTAPSAGALYPLEIYLAAGDVEGLDAGIYRYAAQRHELAPTGSGDRRAELARAALDQDFIREAPASIVVAAVYERTTGKYGERGIRYVHMEVGHVAQNIHLQAAALDLATVVVGAFEDEEIRSLLGLPGQELPVCIMPVGRIS